MKAILLNIFSTSILISFLMGCSKPISEPVTDYFWPLKVGQIFIYQQSDGAKHIINLANINHETDGNVRVETDEKIEGIMARSIPPGAFIKTVYNVYPGENIIYSSIFKREHMNKNILLKGPIQEGTEWKVNFVGFNSENERRENIPVRCRIKKPLKKMVLGKELPCIEVSCPFTQRDRNFSNTYSFCKGIGYVSWNTQVRDGEKEYISKEMETLTEIK